MKVTITHSTIAGGVDVSPGDTPNLSANEAFTLFAAGKAVRYVEPEKPAAPVVETAEAAPAPERAEAPHAKKKR